MKLESLCSETICMNFKVFVLLKSKKNIIDFLSTAEFAQRVVKVNACVPEIIHFLCRAKEIMNIYNLRLLKKGQSKPSQPLFDTLLDSEFAKKKGLYTIYFGPKNTTLLNSNEK